jgi:hypothetical protein
MAYSGLASEMRDENGNFKKKLTLKTSIGALLFILFIMGILLLGNLYFIKSSITPPGLLLLWINSFEIFFILHVFDLLIIDYLIIVKWHPKFLKLPDTNYYTSLRPHLTGFVRGIPIGILTSLIISLISNMLV